MCVGIALDHGGFAWKDRQTAALHNAGHEVLDFGAEGSYFPAHDSRAVTTTICLFSAF